MMQHGDVRTFLKHYLQRRVTVDTQAIFRQLDPQTSIMCAACTMSRWIDVDRPWGLTTEQSLSVNKDSQIQAMIQSRAKLKQRLERRAKGKTVDHPQYNDLSRQISNEKQRLRYAVIKEVQQRYVLENKPATISRDETWGEPLGRNLTN